MMPNPRMSGWRPDLDRAARARHDAQGVRYARVKSTAEIPPAKSLAQHRLRVMDQGETGTCYMHAPTFCAEMYCRAFGLESWPICRNLGGWASKQLEGPSGGQVNDGGSGRDVFLSMTPGHVGVCHESLWPFIADAQHVNADARKVAPKAIVEAAAYHFTNLVDVKGIPDSDQLIAAEIAVAIGVVWPDNWGQQSKWHVDSIGNIDPKSGHEVTIGGYVGKGVWPGQYGKYAWHQIFNSWGEIYAPLPDVLAKLVPGYEPSSPNRTGDFWVMDIHLEWVLSQQSEMVAATGAAGLKSNVIDTGWGNVLGPVVIAA